ncbi:hypothetical protein EW145_g7331 [Phellinidium pouzarii]|uniref:Uncharacterized protein n=1 Tax=Phellinidium pouzarii TaxID=167371 RepID=A0A4S4KLV1_9AGAM|nr:hypothetical protein EW145_g7331 [Phellinidium pouzarii]
MFPAYFEGEEDAYGVSTTQAWVQMQAKSGSAEPHGVYDAYLSPRATSPSLNYTHQDMRSIANFCAPITPVCHVCNTPYNELQLGYALAAAVSAPPMSTPYDRTSLGPASAPGSYENSY